MVRVSGETVPKRTYVEAFRLVCWQFLVYQNIRREITPDYDDCPLYCAIYNEQERNGSKDFCGNCEVKIAKDSFEEEATKVLNERLGKKWEKYGLKRLLNTIYDIYDLKNSGIKNLSPAADMLIGVLESEQNRQRRIEDYNEKLKQKNG